MPIDPDQGSPIADRASFFKIANELKGGLNGTRSGHTAINSANSLFWSAALAGAAIVFLTSSPLMAAGDTANGAKLATKWCNGCHSVGSSETARKADAGPLFAELAKKSPAYLETAINKPHDFMPKFPSLSRQDKLDLIAYIRTVK
jgi:mono/diheme cytochrome c family protein